MKTRERKVALNIKIWNDQHELLRIQAFNRGISMAELVREILDNTSYLQKKAAK